MINEVLNLRKWACYEHEFVSHSENQVGICLCCGKWNLSIDSYEMKRTCLYCAEKAVMGVDRAIDEGKLLLYTKNEEIPQRVRANSSMSEEMIKLA